MWGPAATADNDFAYDYLPKLDVPSTTSLRPSSSCTRASSTATSARASIRCLSFPNRKKITEALSKLKFLVVMDPLDTETAQFWQNHGGFNDVDTAKIDTEVIQLPTTCFAEDEGSLTNSGRWLQWHWAARHAAGRSQAATSGSWRSSICA